MLVAKDLEVRAGARLLVGGASFQIADGDKVLVTDIRVVEELRAVQHDGVRVSFGTVDVTHQVVSFLRKRLGTGEVLGEEPLDLPPRELRTRAVWYAVDADLAYARQDYIVGFTISSDPNASLPVIVSDNRRPA